MENIDDIIHTQDPFGADYEDEQSKNRPVGGKRIFDGITKAELAEMEDDDAIIELFCKNPDRFTVCEYYKRGNCRYGDSCRYYHPEHLEPETSSKEKVVPRGIYALDEECCICLEMVLASNRQFGVLDNCDHTFCLKCIREWRSTYNPKVSKHHYRTCPICRRNSYLVIPSDHVVKSGPEKDVLVEEYKEMLKNIPCRYFNKGKGDCPFMNSCLYAHILPTGEVYEYPWKDIKMNIHGEWEDDRDLTLAERFGGLNI